jgi:hypothetical protein
VSIIGNDFEALIDQKDSLQKLESRRKNSNQVCTIALRTYVHVKVNGLSFFQVLSKARGRCYDHIF